MAQLDITRTTPMIKQAYRRPELVQYGTLREITQTMGGTGHSDNVDCQTNSMCKTS